MIQGIIPQHKVIKYQTMSGEDLDIKKFSNMVLPLSYLSQLGRVINGHTKDKVPYPETTIIDLLRPIENEGMDMREDVHNEILGVKNLMEEVCNIVVGKKSKKSSILGSRYGHLINLINFSTLKTPFQLNNFSNSPIYDEEAFLKGAYIFTQVDKFEHRNRVSEMYRTIDGKKINIGGGTCHVASYKALRELEGFKVSQLSSRSNDDDLEELLYRYGILNIVENFDDYKRDSKDEFCLYLKKKKDLGCCDDAMISTVGRLFLNKGPRSAYSAMIGAALIDTVDTLDKMTSNPVTGGADELIGDFISNFYSSHMYKPLVKQEVIDLVIYAGAKNNSGFLPFSSSVTKLNKFQNANRQKKPTTVIKAHIDFVLNGKDTQGLGLGFTQFPSSRFYHIMENIRWRNMEEMGLLKKL